MRQSTSHTFWIQFVQKASKHHTIVQSCPSSARLEAEIPESAPVHLVVAAQTVILCGVTVDGGADGGLVCACGLRSPCSLAPSPAVTPVDHNAAQYRVVVLVSLKPETNPFSKMLTRNVSHNPGIIYDTFGFFWGVRRRSRKECEMSALTTDLIRIDGGPGRTGAWPYNVAHRFQTIHTIVTVPFVLIWLCRKKCYTFAIVWDVRRVFHNKRHIAELKDIVYTKKINILLAFKIFNIKYYYQFENLIQATF